MRIFPSWCGNQIPIIMLTWIRDWTTSWPNLSSDSHPSSLIREAEISPETSVSSITVHSFTFQKRDLKIYSVKMHFFKFCLILISHVYTEKRTLCTYNWRSKNKDVSPPPPSPTWLSPMLGDMNYEAPQALLIPLYNPLIIISVPSPQTFAMCVLGGLAKIKYGRTRFC